jgi:aspartyl-tRNA(Asn)/glutamyl-tRNA(Gln) amidotransferase subunit A
MLNVMAGADPRDRLSFSTGIDYLAALEGEIQGLRVAWSPDLGYAPIDPEVRKIAAAAAARFKELGCHVEEVNPGIPDPWNDIVDPLCATAQASLHLHDLDKVRDLIDPGRVLLIERAKQWSGVEVFAAHARRNEYYHAMRQFMERYDLLLTPTLPVTAFPAGEDYPPVIDGKPTTYVGWTAFTYPFNITGQPAATVPCGFASNGLPVGLQIVGRWRDDVTVLRASAAFEALAPWAQKRPSL